MATKPTATISETKAETPTTTKATRAEAQGTRAETQGTRAEAQGTRAETQGTRAEAQTATTTTTTTTSTSTKSCWKGLDYLIVFLPILYDELFIVLWFSNFFLFFQYFF